MKEWDTLLEEFFRLTHYKNIPKRTGFEALLTGFIEVESLARDREVVETKEDKADFEGLLEGFEEANRRWRKQQAIASEEISRRACNESMSAVKSHFESLLAGFAEAETLARARELEESKEDETDFSRLLEAYDEIFRRWREQQVTVAEDFNLVELLGCVHDENRHSDVLAWLLNADVHRATHSQGNRGFRAFLRQLDLPAHYADGAYQVRREAQHTESRVDIEVASRGRFVIHIEVKIGSGEGRAQLEREWRDLQQTAERYGITEEGHIHALYLTPRGEKPSLKRFKPVSWKQIARVFEEFAMEAEAESVKWFAGHYALALYKFVVQRRDEEVRNA